MPLGAHESSRFLFSSSFLVKISLILLFLIEYTLESNVTSENENQTNSSFSVNFVLHNCSNGILDGNETDIDCGGNSCVACPDNSRCLKDTDCSSHFCDHETLRCIPQHCFDNILNFNETDVDCGADCVRCDNEMKCMTDNDCMSGFCDDICYPTKCRFLSCGSGCKLCPIKYNCTQNEDCESARCDEGICVHEFCPSDIIQNETIDSETNNFFCGRKPSGHNCTESTECDEGLECIDFVCRNKHCFDGIVSGDETGIDCGGNHCQKCPINGNCIGNKDCVSNFCAHGVCSKDLCNDNVLNGNETDIDCGGDSCKPCKLGSNCLFNSDCISGSCSSYDGICKPSTCYNEKLNFGETDLDCGGLQCDPCSPHQRCIVDSDCTTACHVKLHYCLDSSCSNGLKDGNETDIDCGGNCNPCDFKDTCIIDSDCLSGVCSEITSTCSALSCYDGRLSLNESDIDCGGDCDPCETGKHCFSSKDCAQGLLCGDKNTCVPLSCSNTIRDNLETDIDCGGPSCSPCEALKQCHSNDDCAFGLICDKNLCVNLSCTNLKLDYNETDIDCGGPFCPPCTKDMTCATDKDCESGLTCIQNTCQLSHCQNKGLDFNETDVDCGGNCPPCSEGLHCIENSDCMNNACVNGICEPGHCSNRVKDQDETDVDCGGLACQPCTLYSSCEQASDCNSILNLTCMNGYCQPIHCNNHLLDVNETDIDCGGDCPPCALDQGCNMHSDCTSLFCQNHKCLPSHCRSEECVPGCYSCDLSDFCSSNIDCKEGLHCIASKCQFPTTSSLITTPHCADKVFNFDESDIDCGGKYCPPCQEFEGCKDLTDCDSSKGLVCVQNICLKKHCSNNALDTYTETDIDCGGTDCLKCTEGKVCISHSDCISTNCVDNVCVKGTCEDEIKNELETDVDCGGLECAPCQLSKNCKMNQDCASGSCDKTLKLCVEPHCTNGKQDFDESGLDCGGVNCRYCALRSRLESCQVDYDCPYESKCFDAMCTPDFCFDGMLSPYETDVDCGGLLCPPCELLKTCKVNSDCKSEHCSTNSFTCRESTCFDNIKNFNESDIDCGGVFCDKCANNKQCVTDRDCNSGFCASQDEDVSLCKPVYCRDNQKNYDETDIDCGGSCIPCRDGQHCVDNSDCLDGVCNIIDHTCITKVAKEIVIDCGDVLRSNIDCLLPEAGYFSCEQHWLDDFCDDQKDMDFSCKKYSYDNNACKFTESIRDSIETFCEFGDHEEQDCAELVSIVRTYENSLFYSYTASNRLIRAIDQNLDEFLNLNFSTFDIHVEVAQYILDNAVSGIKMHSSIEPSVVVNTLDQLTVLFAAPNVHIEKIGNTVHIINTKENWANIRSKNILLNLQDDLTISLDGKFRVVGNMTVASENKLLLRQGTTFKMYGNLLLRDNAQLTIMGNTSLAIQEPFTLLNIGKIVLTQNANNDDEGFSFVLQVSQLFNFGKLLFQNSQIILAHGTVLLNFPWGEMETDKAIFKSVDHIHPNIINFGLFSSNNLSLDSILLNYGLFLHKNGDIFVEADVINGGILEINENATLILSERKRIFYTEQRPWAKNIFRSYSQNLLLTLYETGKIFSIPKDFLVSRETYEFSFVLKGKVKLGVGSSIILGPETSLFLSANAECDIDANILHERTKFIVAPIFKYDLVKYNCIRALQDERNLAYMKKGDQNFGVGSSNTLGKSFEYTPDMGTIIGNVNFTEQNYIFNSSTLIIGEIYVGASSSLAFLGPVTIIGIVHNEGQIILSSDKSFIVGEYSGSGEIEVSDQGEIAFVGMFEVSGPLSLYGYLGVGITHQIQDVLIDHFDSATAISLPICSVFGNFYFEIHLFSDLGVFITFNIQACFDESLNDLVNNGLLPEVFKDSEPVVNGLFVLNPQLPFHDFSFNEGDVVSLKTNLNFSDDESIRKIISFPGASLKVEENGILLISGPLFSDSCSLEVERDSFISILSGNVLQPTFLACSVRAMGNIWFEYGSNTIIKDQFVSMGNVTNYGNTTIVDELLALGKFQNYGSLEIARSGNATFQGLQNFGELIVIELAHVDFQGDASFAEESVLDSAGVLACFNGVVLEIFGILISTGDFLGFECTLKVFTKNFYLEGLSQFEYSVFNMASGSQAFIGGDLVFQVPGTFVVDPTAIVEIAGFAHFFCDDCIQVDTIDFLIKGTLRVETQGHLLIETLASDVHGKIEIYGQVLFSSTVADTKHHFLPGSELYVSETGFVKFDTKTIVVNDGFFNISGSIEFSELSERKSTKSKKLFTSENSKLLLSGTFSVKPGFVSPLVFKGNFDSYNSSMVNNAGEMLLLGSSNLSGSFINNGTLTFGNGECFNNNTSVEIKGFLQVSGVFNVSSCASVHVYNVLLNKGMIVINQNATFEMFKESVLGLEKSSTSYILGVVTFHEHAVASIDGFVYLSGIMDTSGMLTFSKHGSVYTLNEKKGMIYIGMSGGLFLESGIFVQSNLFVEGITKLLSNQGVVNFDGNFISNNGLIEIPYSKIDDKVNTAVIVTTGNIKLKHCVLNLKPIHTSIASFDITPMLSSRSNAISLDECQIVHDNSVTNYAEVSESVFNKRVYESLHLRIDNVLIENSAQRKLSESSFGQRKPKCYTNGLGHLPSGIQCNFPFVYEGKQFFRCAGSGYGGQGFCYFNVTNELGGCSCESGFKLRLPTVLKENSDKFLPYFTSGPHIEIHSTTEIKVSFAVNKKAKVVAYMILANSYIPTATEMKNTNSGVDVDAFVEHTVVHEADREAYVMFAGIDGSEKYDIFFFLEDFSGHSFSNEDVIAHRLTTDSSEDSNYIGDKVSQDLIEFKIATHTDSASRSYSVRLRKRPNSLVKLTILVTSNHLDVIVKPEYLQFSVANWAKYQNVEIRKNLGSSNAVNSSTSDIILRHLVSSEDKVFDRLNTEPIILELIH